MIVEQVGVVDIVVLIDDAVLRNRIDIIGAIAAPEELLRRLLRRAVTIEIGILAVREHRAVADDWLHFGIERIFLCLFIECDQELLIIPLIIDAPLLVADADIVHIERLCMSHIDAHLRPICLIGIGGVGIALSECDEIERILDKVLNAVVVTPLECTAAVILRHTAQTAVDDRDRLGAELFAQHEVLIVAKAVLHLIIGAPCPDIGVVRTRCLFAAGRHFARRAVHIERISERGNDVAALRRHSADGVLPVEVLIRVPRSAFNDAAAREAEECGRQIFDRLIQITLDTRCLVCIGRLKLDIIKICRTRSIKRQAQRRARTRLVHRAGRGNRRLVFDPVRAAHVDLSGGIDFAAPYDLDRDLSRIALDKCGEHIVRPFDYGNGRRNRVTAVA